MMGETKRPSFCKRACGRKQLRVYNKEILWPDRECLKKMNWKLLWLINADVLDD